MSRRYRGFRIEVHRADGQKCMPQPFDRETGAAIPQLYRIMVKARPIGNRNRRTPWAWIERKLTLPQADRVARDMVDDLYELSRIPPEELRP